MFSVPSSPLHDFIVCCKACGENIPAPVETLPAFWIITHCPLCGEDRRYLSNDIFRGRLSWKLMKKPVRSVGRTSWGR